MTDLEKLQTTLKEIRIEPILELVAPDTLALKLISPPYTKAGDMYFLFNLKGEKIGYQIK